MYSIIMFFKRAIPCYEKFRKTGMIIKNLSKK